MTDNDDVFPVILASAARTEDGEQAVEFATRAPGQVAAQPNPSGVVVLRGAVSGNPKADPVTGRFAGGKTGRSVTQQGNDVVVTQQSRTLPQGVTQEQWEKRQDIVRDAARQLAEINPAKAKAYLDAHPTVNGDQVNIAAFVMDVQAAQLDDLVDAIRQKSSSGFVSLKAGNRYIKSKLNGLDDAQVENVARRLQSTGMDLDDVNTHVVSRIRDKERRTRLENALGLSEEGDKK